MRYKYKFIGDFNVSDEYRMRKLKTLASKGWILEDISKGVFYKFRKDDRKDLYYTVDYNSNCDEKYFNKYIKAGWDKVLSYDNTMHIFSSKKNIKISSSNFELDKATTIKDIIVKQIKLLSIINLICIALLSASMFIFEPVFLVFGLLWIVELARLVGKTFDYFLYHERIKMINKYGYCKESITNNITNSKVSCIFQVLFSIIFLGGAINEFSSNMVMGLLGILLAFFCILIAYTYYKNYKKALKSI